MRTTSTASNRTLAFIYISSICQSLSTNTLPIVLILRCHFQRTYNLFTFLLIIIEQARFFVSLCTIILWRLLFVGTRFVFKSIHLFVGIKNTHLSIVTNSSLLSNKFYPRTIQFAENKRSPKVPESLY